MINNLHKHNTSSHTYTMAHPSMKIIRGEYAHITTELEIFTYINAKAELICNNTSTDVYTNVSFDNTPMITYDRLIKHTLSSPTPTYKDFTHAPYDDIPNPLPNLPKITRKDIYECKQKKYNKLRASYRDNYKKRQLLLENYHKFYNEIQLKYFVLKEFILQNYPYSDMCLIYEIFGIGHYLSILLCYCDQIERYSTNLSTQSHNAVAMLSKPIYKFEFEQDDHSNGGLQSLSVNSDDHSFGEPRPYKKYHIPEPYSEDLMNHECDSLNKSEHCVSSDTSFELFLKSASGEGIRGWRGVLSSSSDNSAEYPSPGENSVESIDLGFSLYKNNFKGIVFTSDEDPDKVTGSDGTLSFFSINENIIKDIPNQSTEG
jgi:hypothetical protein